MMMDCRRYFRAAFACLTALLLSGGAGRAQTAGRVLTDQDYKLAESRLGYRTNLLVAHTVRQPEFLPGNRVWYRDASPAGDGVHMRATYVIVDPATKTVSPAFDQAALSTAIAAATPGKPAPVASDLHLDDLKLLDLDASGHPGTVTFAANGQRLRCKVAAAVSCALDAAIVTGPDADPPSVLSPDGTHAAFIRNWNLWMRDAKTGAETQLTKDGVPDFGYATDNAGWTHSDKAILVWSPDSKRIATFQQDQRKTGMMYMVPVTNTHPVLEAWRYPLVGDKDVTMIERVVIDVPSGKVVRFKMPPDQHRSTICDDVSCSGGWDDVEWAPDAKTIAFVSTSREHKDEWLRVADAKTGDVRTVFHESAPKFFESGDERVNWHYLPESNDFLWFSERSGWGQMYLYDLTTGALKNQITTGDGNVTQVLSVDRKARRLVYLAVGKNAGEDPYYRNLYASDFAGGAATRLTPSDVNHAVTLSDDGAMFVDIASTPTTPQVTTLRDTRTGAEVMPVAKQDISALLATGWQPETPFTVLARDGKTTLYGYMTRPTKFDPARKYPLINYIYPGPQIGSCGSRDFHSANGDSQALAELGFIVMCLDGMGTPSRSKAFHEAYYADLGDNTLPDQVTGMKQLAAKYSFIDLERVGIWGHSGGGNATGAAMLHYPDLFKVGIAESGNHDQRDYEDDWAEKWAGLEKKNPDGTSNYDSQANQNFAKNLKGHLLLAHGTMDDNVPLNNTLLLVDALIKANKDFDLLLIPNAHHGYGAASQYMMRRRWDYFVRYLAGDTPPHEYLMTSWAEVLKDRAE